VAGDTDAPGLAQGVAMATATTAVKETFMGRVRRGWGPMSFPGWHQHEVLAHVPMPSIERVRRLAADMRENGQREPIVTVHNATVVAGRARLMACEILRREPVIVDWEDAGLGRLPHAHIITKHRAALEALDADEQALVVTAAAEETIRYATGWEGRPDDSGSFVYIMQSGDDGPIKVGVSRDPERRLRQVRVLGPAPLRLLAKIPGGEREETALHHLHREHRLHGEWFAPQSALAEFARLVSRRRS
jgi:hypothetical protein